MDAISSVGAMPTAMPQMVAGDAAASLSGTGGAMGAVAAGADMQMTMIQESVSTMLSSIGGESMASNDVLKMAIALLILNMLSGKEQSSDSKDMMNALLTGMIAGGMSAQGSSGMTAISMETTTASVSIGQSVSMGYVQQSYSAASVSTGGLSAVA